MEAASSRHRHEAKCHAQLARLLAAAGKHERAVGHFRRALEELAAAPVHAAATRQLRADLAAVNAQLARSLAALKQHSEAVRVYQSLLRDGSEDVDADVLVNLAAQLMVLGGTARLQDAERHCARAVALRPSCPEAHYNLNVVMRRLGRQQQAVDLYWRYLERGHGVRRLDSCDNNRSRQDHVLCAPMPTAEAARQGVAVLCVKWGDKYGAEYVNKLYSGVTRHWTSEARLEVICLTDDPAGVHQCANLHCVSLESGWTGWWNKCQVFAPRIEAQVAALDLRRCVYIDLDTVIVGDVSDVLTASCGDRLALLKTDGMVNEQRSRGYNSSVMAWAIEDAPQLSARVYQTLKEHSDAVSRYIYKFDHWLEMVVPRAGFLQDAAAGQIVEYCSLEETKDGDRTLPMDARVVCFPLQPKPHEASASWVREFWK